MNGRSMIRVLFAMLVCIAVASPVFAKEKAEKKGRKAKGEKVKTTKVVLVGKVAVTKDETGKKVTIKLVDATVKDAEGEAKTYNVLVNRRTKGLEEMDGKKVELAGAAFQKGEEMWVRAAKVTEVKEGADDEGAEGGDMGGGEE